MEEVLKKGKISKLLGGDSNQTFLLKHEGKKYVLREYDDEDEARYYENLSKKLMKYGFIPNLYHRHKNKLIFEFIEGRDCKKQDALKVADQVGRICAIINKTRVPKNAKVKQKEIDYAIEILKERKFFNEPLINSIKAFYERLRKKVKPKLALDFDDVYPQNFRLRKGKVYLVDINDINSKYLGRGIGKGFIRWFRTKEQRKRFIKGYERVRSSKFLTEEYLLFLYLNFLIFTIAYKLKNGKTINQHDISRLVEIVDDDE